MRTFCQEMREWKASIFGATDFKLTDNLPEGQDFGGELKIMRVAELVNYGLKGQQPNLKNGGVHLDAKAYHEQMQHPDTVIIDVRNSYEADIGRFNPPEGMYSFNISLERRSDLYRSTDADFHRVSQMGR
jgi:predicted sulfurtransferase